MIHLRDENPATLIALFKRRDVRLFRSRTLR